MVRLSSVIELTEKFQLDYVRLPNHSNTGLLRDILRSLRVWSLIYASVNSTCAQPPPPLPRADPGALALFLSWMANSRGWGLLSCQIPRGGDEKRGQMPHPPSTLQHFLLIAQSNSAVLSILMCDFLNLINGFFVIARGF